MALPTFTMKQLMEAGVHFGHHTRRWNPLMTPYVYGVKDKIHIINLNKTAPLLHRSLVALEAIAAAGGKILFVATKHQAKDIVKDAAERCGQYYVNNRWRDFSPEIDLRGKNGDEAWFLVDKYFDDAQVSGISTVRLIHGKGTGALKAALWRFLKTDGRVASFRIGQFGEGDGGVTVVELK